MDALQKYMMPAIAKVKALGVEVESPDPAALKAEGQKKVDAICSAANVDEAAKLAQEFQSWGQTEARDKIGNQLSQTLGGKIKAKGDELRDKINKDVKEFADQEAVAMQKEINDLVEQLVETKKAQIQAAAKSAGASGVNSLIAAATSDIEVQVQSLVVDRAAKMKQKIQAKVDEIVGSQKKQFEDIGQALSEAGGKIDEEIKANRSQYDTYKNEAFTLRKILVFKMLDKNMTEGLKQLEAADADIEAARKEDPTIKSVGEVKAALAQDRQALEAEKQKAIADSVKKACSQSLPQLKAAQAEIQGNDLTVLKSNLDKCKGKNTPECQGVNALTEKYKGLV